LVKGPPGMALDSQKVNVAIRKITMTAINIRFVMYLIIFIPVICRRPGGDTAIMSKDFMAILSFYFLLTF